MPHGLRNVPPELSVYKERTGQTNIPFLWRGIVFKHYRVDLNVATIDCLIAARNEFPFSLYRGAGLWDFTLNPVEFFKKMEKNGLYRFTGTFHIVTVPVHVEILTGISLGRTQFAVGFTFDKESFGKLSEQLSGIGIDFLDVIGQGLEVRRDGCVFLYLPLIFITKTE